MNQDVTTDDGTSGLTLEQYDAFCEEIAEQPSWRTAADRESDFFDNNQLDSEIIRRQQAIGLPSAIEPLMGPELDKLCGIEARLRKDCKVIPNSDKTDDDLAEALNVELNTAERHSKADKACSNAFREQAGVGVSWVEVARVNDPFRYPYKVDNVSRNECHWDWKGTLDPDMHDHRFFRRRRWVDKDQAKLLFPDSAELIEQAATGWANYSQTSKDGGLETGLYNSAHGISWTGGGSGMPTALSAGGAPGTFALLSSAYGTEQSRPSKEHQEWRDLSRRRVLVTEMWYRVWSNALVLTYPDGRVVAFEQDNGQHMYDAALGHATPSYRIISKVYVSMWIGPHKLSDTPCPFKHNRFPYVPFWHKREERTKVPFGLGRGWIYLQECVNAVSAKLRWGISAINVVMTEGAYKGTLQQLKSVAARLDSIIELDAKEMSKPGAKFELSRDFQLTDQQFKLMEDSRNAIRRTGAGLIEDQAEGQLEQIPNQHGILFDNLRESRSEMMTLLLSLIIEDIGNKQHAVSVKGNATTDDRTVMLNAPQPDGTITNDVQIALLKVDLEDVPSTPSYRAQQLQSFSEVVKSAPPDLMPILYPHMLALTDIPNKDKAIAAIREAGTAPTQEQIQQQIDTAVQQALLKAGVDNKQQELALKKELQDAKIAQMAAETVLTRVTSFYEATQAGGVVASAPGVAEVGDVILQGAGYTPPTPAGVNPGIENIPMPQQTAQPNELPVIRQNTHPGFPPHPASPEIGAQSGIETPRLGD
jgi:hypothetical protein